MRKRNVTHAADTIFWWVLYALPLIFGLIFAIGASFGLAGAFSTIQEFNFAGDFFENSQFGESQGSISGGVQIMTSFIIEIVEYVAGSLTYGTEFFFVHWAPSMFESPIAVAIQQVIDSFLGDYIFSSAYADGVMIVNILAWFIYMHIFHIFVDFIVFIPRLCHKWMGKAYQED